MSNYHNHFHNGVLCTDKRCGSEESTDTRVPEIHSSVVHHPAHYGGDVTYEAIKVIEAWNLTFNTGNAAKYICRAGKKGDAIEDLEKSREYLRFEIERLKRKKT